MNRKIPKVPPADRAKLNEGVDKDECTSELFNDILRKTPLYTRLKVNLEMEYLNVILQGSECCNDEEFRQANEWSKKITVNILQTIKEWERDGRPENVPKIPDKV